MDRYEIYQIEVDKEALFVGAFNSATPSDAILSYIRSTPYIFFYNKWDNISCIYKQEEDRWLVVIWGDLEVNPKINILLDSYEKMTNSTKPKETKKPPAKKKEQEEKNIDPATARLMADALKTHNLIVCPDCGNKGVFVRCALWCPDCKKAFGGF